MLPSPLARDFPLVDLCATDVGAHVGEVGVSPCGLGEEGRIGVVDCHGDE